MPPTKKCLLPDLLKWLPNRSSCFLLLHFETITLISHLKMLQWFFIVFQIKSKLPKSWPTGSSWSGPCLLLLLHLPPLNLTPNLDSYLQVPNTPWIFHIMVTVHMLLPVLAMSCSSGKCLFLYYHIPNFPSSLIMPTFATHTTYYA